MGMFDDLIPGFGRENREESDAERQGRELPSWLQGGMTAIQGGTLGFADEIGGLGGALAGGVANLFNGGTGKDFGTNYRETRDAIRGANKQFAQDYPTTTMLSQLATAAPLAVATGNTAAGGRLAASNAVPLGFGRSVAQAAGTGGAWGAIEGAGRSTSENPLGVLGDAAVGGVQSAALGGGVQAGIGVSGAIASNVAQRLSKTKAYNFAREKLAEAIARDNPGNPTAIEDLIQRMRGLGNEARVVDAGDESLRGTLDTVAQMPGTSRTAAAAAVRARQASRGPRLVEAADEALGTGGSEFTQTVTDFISERARKAGPLYEKVKNLPVEIDASLAGVMGRVERSDLARLRHLVKRETGQDINLDLFKEGSVVPLSYLDGLKQSLWDAARSAARNGDDNLASKIHGVRTDLVKNLDANLPASYRKARAAYADPSQMIEAANAGRAAMKDDLATLADSMSGLDGAQLDAFRVGAYAALKEKLGSGAGQTQLLKFWKEPNTQDRLKLIFGDKYNDFTKALVGEDRMRRVESVVGGSPTMMRKENIEDLAMSPSKVTSPRGILQTGMDWAASAARRAAVPEATRNELGNLLLQQGAAGRVTLNELRNYLEMVNEARLRNAGVAGAFSGYASQYRQ